MKKLARIFGEYRGEFSASETYLILDEVLIKGDGVYRAIKDVPRGTQPSNKTYWKKTVSDASIAPALSPVGVGNLKGQTLSLKGMSLTVPTMQVLYRDVNGDIVLETKLSKTFVVNPTIHTHIVVDNTGVMKLSNSVAITDVVIVTFSWWNQSSQERSKITAPTLQNFFLSIAVDKEKHLDKAVALSAFGAKMNDPVSVEKAFELARNFMSPGGTLFIDGNYACKSTCYFDELPDISVIGGKLYKDPNVWKGEYLLRFNSCHRVVVNNVALEGLHGEDLNPTFGEQGLYFRACDGATAMGCSFKSFGDAGVRYHSGGYDSATVPAKVGSFDIRVIGCTFHYCQQNTMTPGGSTRVIFTGNTFVKCSAAVKLASRVQDAFTAIIVGNIVQDCTSDVFPIQGGKYINISDNVVFGCKEFVTLSSNSDGVNNQYPNPVSYEEVMVNNNIVKGATDRFMYLQNRGLFLNNKDVLPSAGKLIMRGNYFEQKNTGTEQAPVYPVQDVIRFFSHTVTGEGGKKIQACIASLIDISDNIFVNGNDWMRNNCSTWGASKVFLERNKILNYKGQLVNWSNITSEQYDTSESELHIIDNYADKGTTAFGIGGPLGGKPFNYLRIQGNNIKNLSGGAISTLATDKGVAGCVDIIGNNFETNTLTDTGIYLVVGDPGRKIPGKTLFTDNRIIFTNSKCSSRPFYTDTKSYYAGGRVIGHNNLSYGTTGKSRDDSSANQLPKYGITDLV